MLWDVAMFSEPWVRRQVGLDRLLAVLDGDWYVIFSFFLFFLFLSLIPRFSVDRQQPNMAVATHIRCLTVY